MDIDDVRSGFIASGIPTDLTDELLETFAEAKRRFFLGDHRPNAIEGGRFSEAVFRVLQHQAFAKYTPIGKTLPTVDKLIDSLANVPAGPTAESVRIHIPRTLRLIYDIRNKRDAAHLADGIDPNLQDATLVVNNMDWVMAELVRLHHSVTPGEAQQIVVDLVTKSVPAVQEIDGQPVVLTDLEPRDQALLMLYRAGDGGATLDDLAEWLRVSKKANLLTRLRRLDELGLALEHPKSARFHITLLGVRDVEERGLTDPV